MPGLLVWLAWDSWAHAALWCRLGELQLATGDPPLDGLPLMQVTQGCRAGVCCHCPVFSGLCAPGFLLPQTCLEGSRGLGTHIWGVSWPGRTLLRGWPKPSLAGRGCQGGGQRLQPVLPGEMLAWCQGGSGRHADSAQHAGVCIASGPGASPTAGTARALQPGLLCASSHYAGPGFCWACLPSLFLWS